MMSVRNGKWLNTGEGQGKPLDQDEAYQKGAKRKGAVRATILSAKGAASPLMLAQSVLGRY
jgi:hypothetical protein